MSTSTMQLCLLLAVFVPLASFVFIAFFGTRLPGKGPGGHGHGHDDHGHGDGHGHDDHGHADGCGHDDHSHGGHSDHGHADAHGHAAHSHAPAHHDPHADHKHLEAGQHGHGEEVDALATAHEADVEHEHHAPPKKKRVPGGNPTAAFVATGAIGFSFVMAALVFFNWFGPVLLDGGDIAWQERTAAEAAANSVLWANLGPVPIHFGVKLDALTVIMFLMVTLCATCIHVFSIGYMKHDPRFPRFFAYLSLFCFSMLGLLISQSILFLFIFWELVGLCSYLLIGFWFEKKSASNAAIKAFVTNRVGDFGFLIGLMLCFMYLGTLDLDMASARFEAATQHAGVSYGERSAAAAEVPSDVGKTASALFDTGFLGVSLATWMGLGLFCGAIGKSAQFPLQVWLPDAMEGPTPVSALIHAATMVAAGVYLVGRIYTLLTAEALMAIAIIGCITLTMAALIAIVQTDIKRVLAFSTLSQLGYMIFAMGIGAWVAALFHLLTHAFFKAMLFLGSGQVIEGCHHEQDMSRMGGLFRKMPVTAITFLIAVLAISGVGIPLTPIGIGGFYSKDEILAVGYYRHFSWGHAGEAHASNSNNSGASSKDSGAGLRARAASGEGLRARAASGAGLRARAASGAGLRARQQAGTPAPPGSEQAGTPAPLSLNPSRAPQHPSRDLHHPSRDRKGAVAPVGAAPVGAAVLASWTQDHAEAPPHAQQPETAAQDSPAQEHGDDPAHGGTAVHPGAAEALAADDHRGRDYAGEYPRVHTLPFILFFLPILVAYITPFYMGRCFMLTFMGKPRDQHIHDNAHESPVMTMPLVVLAIMTLISGPFIFRGFVDASAPGTPPLVPMIDGEDHGVHAVHVALAIWVGPAFAVGLLLAFAMYRNGFAVASRVRALPGMNAVHNLLWNKFYFDQIYNSLFVMGTRGFAVVCALFDAWIIDGLVNLSGYFTRAIGWFTGIVLDNRGVDGAVNGTGRLAWSLGGMFRSTHTGVIRNYIMMTAIVVAGVIVWMWSPSLAVLFVILGACVIAAPALCYNVVAPLLVAAVAIRVMRIVLVGFGQTGDAGAWNWDALTNFWLAYFTSPAGYAELAIVLMLYAALMVRYRGLRPPEPEYVVAPVSNR